METNVKRKRLVFLSNGLIGFNKWLIDRNNLETKKLTDQKKEIIIEIASLKKKLRRSEETINDKFDLTYHEILEKTRMNEDMVLTHDGKVHKKTLNSMDKAIAGLYDAYKMLHQITIDVEKAKIKVHSKGIINEAIRMYFEEWLKLIIYKGEQLQLHNLLGNIFFTIGTPREVINWKRSNELKQQIIDNGGTPLKIDRDENLKPISSNGGEPFLATRLTKGLFGAWRNKLTKNSGFYKLDMNDNVLLAVSQLHDSSPHITSQYQRKNA